MRTLLITGGAGFIGTNFVHLAAAGDDRIIVLDKLTYAGNVDNLSSLIDGGRIEFVHGDIGDPVLVASLLAERGVSHIVHFAAESHVDRSITGPAAFIDTNIGGTFNLIDCARAAWQGRDDVRFLHVSTDEVFGDLGPDDPPFTEDTPYRPSSPYSASKAAADMLVRAWIRTYGFPAMVANCSNNYGPWQFPEKLIPLMIVNAMAARPLPVYGDGLQIRDWLHVADHCDALMTILNRGELGETYAIGGECERTNLAVVDLICAAVDRHCGHAPGTSAALKQSVTDRPGHDRRYAVRPAKLAATLGWRPTRLLESEIDGLVDWYAAHADWIEAIRSGAYREFYQQQYAERLDGAAVR